MSRNSGPNVFQRGVMALILLSLLRREDMYGYQLVQEIERCSGGQLKTQEGSLYPVLYRIRPGRRQLSALRRKTQKAAADGAAQRGGGLLRRNPGRRPGSPVRDAPAGGRGVCGRHEHPGVAGRPAAAASGADHPDRGGADGAATVGGGPLRQLV